MKHTKGPWTAKTYSNTNKCFVVANGSIIYEEITQNSNMISANARLIAAAPELFEVLQLIGTIANIGLETDSDYKNRMLRISQHATEIIKKARGE